MESEFDESSLEEWLPGQFTNIISAFEGNAADNFVAEIRSSVTSGSECEEWVQCYQKSSRTDWIVRRTYPHVFEYQFKKDWCCSHANKGKINLCGNYKVKY